MLSPGETTRKDQGPEGRKGENRMRIYGKAKQISENYFEVPYKEYRADGSLKQAGSEDFTTDRYSKQLHIYSIHTWNGEKRNAGGKKWYENCGCYKVDTRDGLKEYAASIYPEAVEIQIRKCL